MRLFQLHEQIVPAPTKGCRYRVVEVYNTLDGFRTRMSSEAGDDLDAMTDRVTELNRSVGYQCP